MLYAKKIDKAEARVDFSRPAADLHNLIRGLSPFPGAFFEMDFGKGPERVKILRTALRAGAGAPGEILDETPLDRLRRGRLAPGRGAKGRARRRSQARNFCAARGLPPARPAQAQAAPANAQV